MQIRRVELEQGKLYIVFEHLEMNLTQFMRMKMKTEHRKLHEEEVLLIVKQAL